MAEAFDPLANRFRQKSGLGGGYMEPNEQGKKVQPKKTSEGLAPGDYAQISTGRCEGDGPVTISGNQIPRTYRG